MHTQWKPFTWTLAAMLTGSLVTGVALSLPLPSSLQADPVPAGQAISPSQNLAVALDMSAAFRNVADHLRPTVVSIRSTITPRAVSGRAPRGLPPGFEDLFGGSLNQFRQPPTQAGLGSGVIVRSDGYILTNNHVVEDADELEVELSDGRRFNGTIVGTDPATDLAVIKIEGDRFQAASLGNSDAIRVGDWVVAIGSPFGLEQTVTAGIISAKNRIQGIIGGGQGFEDFLQTDAAINPGNSGGPLVNLQGEVVGINTAIESRSGGSNGIGFAIPTSLARPVVESIIESGEVHRGFLGAQVSDVDPETVEEFDLQVRGGALIRMVLDGQPAANGGMQPGDVVTAIDGRPITSSAQLRNDVASRPPGTTLKMAIQRGPRQLQLEIKLIERNAEKMAMFRGNAGSILGAELEPLDAALAQELGYDDIEGGLAVTKIEQGSTAARAGLNVGDVIVAVNGRAIADVASLQATMRSALGEGDAVQLIVRSGNVRRLIVIR
jgi:serine protease Do